VTTARVADFDPDAALGRAADDPHVATAVLDRIREQISERLRQAPAIRADGHRPCRPVQMHAAAGAPRGQVGSRGGAPDQAIQANGLGLRVRTTTRPGRCQIGQRHPRTIEIRAEVQRRRIRALSTRAWPTRARGLGSQRDRLQRPAQLVLRLRDEAHPLVVRQHAA
jgi:hypothetical protein